MATVFPQAAQRPDVARARCAAMGAGYWIWHRRFGGDSRLDYLRILCPAERKLAQPARAERTKTAARCHRSARESGNDANQHTGPAQQRSGRQSLAEQQRTERDRDWHFRHAHHQHRRGVHALEQPVVQPEREDRRDERKIQQRHPGSRRPARKCRRALDDQPQARQGRRPASDCRAVTAVGERWWPWVFSHT